MRNEIIYYKDSTEKIMATLIPAEYTKEGINFITEDTSYLQVAIMQHNAGLGIIPHYHNKISRVIDYTCETLILRKGILEVNLFEDKKLLYSFKIKSGDVITLFSGGHGFNVIEDVDMIEIKQGPFVGAEDKTRF